MNEPQSISSGQGLLKDDYESDVSTALKRRRKALEEKVAVQTERPSNA